MSIAAAVKLLVGSVAAADEMRHTPATTAALPRDVASAGPAEGRNDRRRRVIVCGAGIIGLTTAYTLAKEGHEVICVEARAGPAQETSFTNGFLLCPSLMSPWTAPAMAHKVLASAWDADSPIRVHGCALLTRELWPWGWHVLRSWLFTHPNDSARRIYRMASHSMACMQGIMRQHPECGAESIMQSSEGTLQVFDLEQRLNASHVDAPRLSAMGCHLQRVSREECTQLAPGLRSGRVVGGMLGGMDTNGDVHLFSRGLVTVCERMGVTFMFGARVAGFLMQPTDQPSRLPPPATLMGRVHQFVRQRVATRMRVHGVTLQDGSILHADDVVLAAGNHVPMLARKAGVAVPVCPVKGYLVTLSLASDRQQLRVNVVDDANKLYISPLGANRVRLSGCAEFAGFDSSVDTTRTALIARNAANVFEPGTFRTDDVEVHTGLRPLSPDDVPIVGRTEVDNLWLNCGHGSKGWTLACGAAQLVADLICERQPAIDPADYSLTRFRDRWRRGADATAPAPSLLEKGASAVLQVTADAAAPVSGRAATA